MRIPAFGASHVQLLSLYQNVNIFSYVVKGHNTSNTATRAARGEREGTERRGQREKSTTTTTPIAVIRQLTHVIFLIRLDQKNHNVSQLMDLIGSCGQQTTDAVESEKYQSDLLLTKLWKQDIRATVSLQHLLHEPCLTFITHWLAFEDASHSVFFILTGSAPLFI